MNPSRNPTVGELARTDHPALPILEIEDPQGYIPTGKIFPKGNLGIIAEVRINMGRLIFTDGTTGWCNLCYLEVVG